MDAGLDTFALDIPARISSATCWPGAARHPAQCRRHAHEPGLCRQRLHPDIVSGEVREFLQRLSRPAAPPVDLALRARFNPQLDKSWFGAVMEVINNITMLSIVLTGAALIREREHGTVEHLLVMPVTPFEIMTSKVWAMALVVLVASGLRADCRRAGAAARADRGLARPVSGRRRAAPVRHHVDGHLPGHLARSMPQFGLLMMLVLLPLQMLSGGMTPRESMPEIVQQLMLAGAHHPFRHAGPGDPLPRRRGGRRLAAVPRPRPRSSPAGTRRWPGWSGRTNSCRCPRASRRATRR
jgi:ABC-2 type transport system permease protein